MIARLFKTQKIKFLQSYELLGDELMLNYAFWGENTEKLGKDKLGFASKHFASPVSKINFHQLLPISTYNSKIF